MSTPTLLRSQVADLSRLAENDLRVVYRQVETAELARQMLNDVLPTLVQTYGSASVAIAADWYDEARVAQGVPGRFTAVPAVLRNPNTHILVGWALSEALDPESALSLVIGGVTKRIANAARDTIQGSAVADPRADGWQRLASPGSCEFCRMIAQRGAVFTEATVKFGAHDNCLCQAAPAFKGRPRPVDQYVPSLKRRSDETREADNARAREWIANNL